ncbi:unnamed protein product [Effrenium voratum]|nr:unnamed protein product [Effrenium voratum]
MKWGPNCVIKRVDKDQKVLGHAQPEEMQQVLLSRASMQKRLGACAEHVKTMTREEKLHWALDLKDQANQSYASSKFEEAAQLYNDCLVGLDFDGDDAQNSEVATKLQLPICTNLAACLIEMGKHEECAMPGQYEPLRMEEEDAPRKAKADGSAGCCESPCCAFCGCVCCVLLISLLWIVLNTGTTQCGMTSFPVERVLPANAAADGATSPFVVGTSQNQAIAPALNIDLTGVWWMDGNPLTIEQLISWAGAQGVPPFPSDVLVPTNRAGQWSYSDSFFARIVMAFYSFTSFVEETHDFRFFNDSFAEIAPVSEAVFSEDFLFTKINADEWDRGGVYIMRRVIYEDGTPHPQFWQKFLDWYYTIQPNGKMLVYSTNNQCIRRCEYLMPCFVCTAICGSDDPVAHWTLHPFVAFRLVLANGARHNLAPHAAAIEAQILKAADHVDPTVRYDEEWFEGHCDLSEFSQDMLFLGPEFRLSKRPTVDAHRWHPGYKCTEDGAGRAPEFVEISEEFQCAERCWETARKVPGTVVCCEHHQDKSRCEVRVGWQSMQESDYGKNKLNPANWALFGRHQKKARLFFSPPSTHENHRYVPQFESEEVRQAESGKQHVRELARQVNHLSIDGILDHMLSFYVCMRFLPDKDFMDLAKYELERVAVDQDTPVAGHDVSREEIYQEELTLSVVVTCLESSLDRGHYVSRSMHVQDIEAIDQLVQTLNDSSSLLNEAYRFSVNVTEKAGKSLHEMDKEMRLNEQLGELSRAPEGNPKAVSRGPMRREDISF